MLRFFRINDPYRLLGLLVLMILLSLPSIIDSPGVTTPELESVVIGEKSAEGFRPYAEIVDDSGPMATWFYGACDWIFGRSYTARHIITLIILFLQSAFWGITLINRKVFTENTFVPSLIFGMLMLGSFDLLTLHADVAAFGFTLLVLNNLYREIEFGGQRDETVFNLGLYVGIASMLNYSFIVYLPGSMIVLLLFTTNRLRSYLLMMVGTLLPHVLLSIYYFYNDQFDYLWFDYYGHWFAAGPAWVSALSLLILSAVPLFYLLISFFILNRDAHFTKYQSQILQAAYIWFIISFIQVWLTPDRRPQSLIVLIPSASFIISHYLLMIRRKRWANLNTWIVILGMAGFGQLARYTLLPNVNYQSLLVGQSSHNTHDKSVLDLDHDDFAVFKNNTLAPPFVNAEMTNSIFDGADYYENVLLVDRLFAKNPPDIIFDKEHRIEVFFNRIPYLKLKYSQTNEGYTLISN